MISELMANYCVIRNGPSHVFFEARRSFSKKGDGRMFKPTSPKREKASGFEHYGTKCTLYDSRLVDPYYDSAVRVGQWGAGI
jgi:hypothetical protein